MKKYKHLMICLILYIFSVYGDDRFLKKLKSSVAMAIGDNNNDSQVGNEPVQEKSNNLHMRNQRRRSAVQ